MKQPIKVVIVDDHPLFRTGVARTLEETGRFEIVGQGASADDAVRLAREVRSDILLLDLSMPGGGLDAARAISATTTAMKIIVLTASESDDDLLSALRAGAHGYVVKGVSSSALVDAIIGVANGEGYVSPALAARLLTEMRPSKSAASSENPLSELTPREEEILGLVGQGQSNKEIGRKLNLQEKSVKHHMTRILDKLHVRNRTEAALFLRDSRREPG